jgi:uracil phosphoribosyltransferase
LCGCFAGKVLIQRDEKSEDKHPIMYYSKLPPNVEKLDNVLLVDPMLATGGSVNMAIKARNCFDASAFGWWF